MNNEQIENDLQEINKELVFATKNSITVLIAFEKMKKGKLSKEEFYKIMGEKFSCYKHLEIY